jgi:hypothetical protein
MPTAKQLAYDHVAYQVPQVFAGSSTAGANGVTTKFGAFTAMQLRRVAYAPNIASTSSTQPLLYSKSGTSTTTTTLSAVTSAATTAIDYVLATAISLAQGDQFWVAHGTDATVSLSVGIECYVTPGASIACP